MINLTSKHKILRYWSVCSFELILRQIVIGFACVKGSPTVLPKAPAQEAAVLLQGVCLSYWHHVRAWSRHFWCVIVMPYVSGERPGVSDFHFATDLGVRVAW